MCRKLQKNVRLTCWSDLTLAAGNTDTLADSLDSNKFGELINQMSVIIRPQDRITKHDDFLLLWDQLVDKDFVLLSKELILLQVRLFSNQWRWKAPRRSLVIAEEMSPRFASNLQRDSTSCHAIYFIELRWTGAARMLPEVDRSRTSMLSLNCFS